MAATLSKQSLLAMASPDRCPSCRRTRLEQSERRLPSTSIPSMPSFRFEQPADVPAIHALHAAAFPTPAEARLVDLLRAAGHLSISLVAERNNEIVGHVAFSPVTTASGDIGAG